MTAARWRAGGSRSPAWLRRRRSHGGSVRRPAREEGRVVAVDLDIEHCASHSSADRGRSESSAHDCRATRGRGLRRGRDEEARARQRRHRGVAGAAAMLAAAIAAILWASIGGGGGSRPASDSVPPGRPSSQSARPSLASCLTARARPCKARRASRCCRCLDVLRRPGTPADALPPAIEQNFLGGGFGHDIFVHYIRRARVIAGRSYYVMPVRTGCGSIKPSEGILLACVLRSGQRIVDAGSGGDTTAPQIKQGSAFLVGGSCLHTNQATLIAGIVPDSSPGSPYATRRSRSVQPSSTTLSPPPFHTPAAHCGDHSS